MIVIEIPPNANCESVEMRVFHDVSPSRPVRQVQLERTPGQAAWYDVTGWTANGSPCPVIAHKVDDSGEGVAWLVHGGDAGLRLRPAASQAPWGLDQPDQWGEPFLLLGDAGDLG